MFGLITLMFGYDPTLSKIHLMFVLFVYYSTRSTSPYESTGLLKGGNKSNICSEHLFRHRLFRTSVPNVYRINKEKQ